jgi:hypothetical protein
MGGLHIVNARSDKVDGSDIAPNNNKNNTKVMEPLACVKIESSYVKDGKKEESENNLLFTSLFQSSAERLHLSSFPFFVGGCEFKLSVRKKKDHFCKVEQTWQETCSRMQSHGR